MNRTQRRARDLEAAGLTPDAAAEIARLANVVHHARTDEAARDALARIAAINAKLEPAR